MYVELTLGANATQILWKILSCGSRFSEGAMFEFTEQVITVRFTSANRTTYLYAEFPVTNNSIFTNQYKIAKGSSTNADEWMETDEEPLSGVHVTCKAVTQALKPSTRCTLAQCTLQYDASECTLRIINRYMKGLTKCFELSISETPLEKPVDTQLSNCIVECEAKQLNRILEIFPTHMSRLMVTPQSRTLALRGESLDTSETRSMDSDANIGIENFKRYWFASDSPKFSKTFDPKGLRVLTELAAHLNVPVRFTAGPGTTPVVLEGITASNGLFSIKMLIASYDAIALGDMTASEEAPATNQDQSEEIAQHEPVHTLETICRSSTVISQTYKPSLSSSTFVATPVPSRPSGRFGLSQASSVGSITQRRRTEASLTFSQVLSQKTPAPIIQSSQSSSQENPSQTSIQPSFQAPSALHSIVDTPVRSQGVFSNIDIGSPVESSALERRYAEGKFPLRIDTQQLQSAQKEHLHSSLSSFFSEAENTLYE